MSAKMMFRTFLIALLLVCAFPICADDSKGDSSNLLICPQCGAWQISNASIDGFVSDIVLVNEHRVVIQGCGIFFYENAEIRVKNISDTMHTYKVDLTFDGRTEDLEHSFVCGGDDEDQNNPKKLHLSIDVKGHYYEGGYADFTFHRQGLKEPLLSFRGWNIDREDPCGIGDGPGFGSLACNQTANGFFKKELWIASAKANANLSKSSQKKCLSQFNPVNFMSKVESYCSNREKESGGFYWPEAWAENCASIEYAEKIRQLLIWNKCIDSPASKSSCVFPVENVCGERCNSQNQ